MPVDLLLSSLSEPLQCWEKKWELFFSVVFVARLAFFFSHSKLSTFRLEAYLEPE